MQNATAVTLLLCPFDLRKKLFLIRISIRFQICFRTLSLSLSVRICEDLVPILHVYDNLVPIFHMCEDFVPFFFYMCEDLVPIVHICEIEYQFFKSEKTRTSSLQIRQIRTASSHVKI